MSELMTNEMVETAARAAFRDGFMRGAPEYENRDLSDYDDGIRESWRVVARAALTAAAPQIAAQALRDAAAWLDDMARGHRESAYLGAGRDLIARLRARADQMEADRG